MGAGDPEDGTASLDWGTTPTLALRVDLGPGLRVGRYVLEDELGAGAMGVVYRARDPELGRALAIKVVKQQSAGSQGRARLLREAQALARLHHPNVVPVFDVGAVGEQVFVVMPYLTGGTLRDWMRGGQRPWREVLDRFIAAGRGLAAAHDAGLIHRDFKPANVLIGAGGEVQVADFGLARLAQEPGSPPEPIAPAGEAAALDLTGTGAMMGTPGYMAPEQLEGQRSDARADQFGFCVALWEALHGARPFDSGNATGAGVMVALLGAIKAGRLAPSPGSTGVPPWLRAIVLRGLSAAPESRWSTMAELIDQLERGRSRRRRWPLAIAAVLTLAVAAVAVAVAMTRRGESPAPAAATPAAAPRARLVRITTRGDLTSAKLSPDGTTLAMIAGDAIVLRAVDQAAEERVLFRIPNSMESLGWSPDGTQLIALIFEPQGPGEFDFIRLIDTATGAITRASPIGDMAAFVSIDEIAVAYNGGRSVALHSLVDPHRQPRECPVPGDYQFLNGLTSFGDSRRLIVETLDERRVRSLVVLARDCTITATIEAGPTIAGYAITSAGSILIDNGKALPELVEVSADGVELGRRQVARSQTQWLFGSHGDREYYLDAGLQTLVQRRARDGTITTALQSGVLASIAVAPDGRTASLIEPTSGNTGPLRISAVDELGRRGKPVLADASSASWSPDGRLLAVAVSGKDDAAVVVLDPASGAQTRWPIDTIRFQNAPVWIDDHRVAGHRRDNRTYEWIDIRTGTRGNVMEPDQGWTFQLGRSPRDGRLAFYWSAHPEGVFLMVPDQVPVPSPLKTLGAEEVRWSRRGDLLVLDQLSGTIDRGDPVTGARTPLLRVPLLPAARLINVAELEGDELLLTVIRPTGDVAVSIPE